MQEIDTEVQKLKLECEIQELVSKIFENEDYCEQINTDEVILQAIAMIDSMNKKCKIFEKGMEDYLNHICKYNADKTNTNLMVMLSKRYKQNEIFSTKHNYKKSKGKEVDDEIVDELEGFCVRNGCYQWNDEKIDAFIESLKK